MRDELKLGSATWHCIYANNSEVVGILFAVVLKNRFTNECDEVRIFSTQGEFDKWLDCASENINIANIRAIKQIADSAKERLPAISPEPSVIYHGPAARLMAAIIRECVLSQIRSRKPEETIFRASSLKHVTIPLSPAGLGNN